MTVGSYYLTFIEFATWTYSSLLFWMGVALFIVSLLGGLFFCMQSVGVLSPKQYMAYMASPKTWGNYVDGLTTYHANYQTGDEIENRVAIDLAPIRRKHYIEAGESNRNSILKKHAYQVRAKKCIGFAVIVMVLTALPASHMQYRAKILAGDKMSKDESKATEQQQPPQKPLPPTIVVVQEGDTSAKGK